MELENENPNHLIAFAKWLDKQRNERLPSYRDMTIWGKEDAFERMLFLFIKESASE